MAVPLFCRQVSIFILNYNTTCLRPGNQESGADHTWAKIKINGEKSLKGGSNFFLVLLPRCSCRCRNYVMSIAICVKTTCFDTIQLCIILRKPLRNMCNFLRSTPIENKPGKASLVFPQNAVDQQCPNPSSSCMWKHKFSFLSFFFLRTTQTDVLRDFANWHRVALPSPLMSPLMKNLEAS